MPFDGAPDQALSLGWYAQRKPVFTGGNQVQLLRGGREMFPAQVKAIDQARQSVWMANYLMSSEGEAGAVLEALSRAAKRGVKVHLVADGIGSRGLPEEFWQALRDSGVQLAIYRPIRQLMSLLWDRTGWRRMHVKLCVVDETLAFVGGINLIDDHFDLSHGWSVQPRLDYAVQVTGPTVTPMLHTVRAMWTRATIGRDWRDDLTDWIRDPARLKRLRQLWQAARLRLTPAEQSQVSSAVRNRQPMRAAFVLRDNLRQRRTIERAAQQAIVHARSRIDIVTPYFYPGRILHKALRQAAERGVKVRLLLQGKVDYRIAGVAARVLYAELQRHGVRIYEYQPALLHAKVLCIDDEWATLGSSNLDPLSLMMNLEANLIVKDRAFALSVSRALVRDFADSREVPHPKELGSSMAARLKRGFISWLAKTYLRLGGAGRYE
jgi:cardiolipin synthase